MAHGKERASHSLCPGTIISVLSILFYSAGFIRVELQLNDYGNKLDIQSTRKQQYAAMADSKSSEQRIRRSVQTSPPSDNSSFAAKKQDVNDHVDALSKLCQRSVGKVCAQGPPGSPGETGAKGEKGKQGRRGQKGRKSPRGTQGIMGPPGKHGKQGMMGPPGLRGPKGDMGDAGPPGPPGPKGEPGESISAPRVIVSPPSVTVNESVTAKILCSVTGNPRPRIEWTKDSGSLPSSRTTVTDLGELQIQNVLLQDSGRYKCSARNVLNVAEGFGRLIVQVRPRVALHVGPTYIAQKTDVTLPTCHVTAFPPAQVTWSKDGGGLPARAFTQGGQLKVVNARKEDSGLYKCQATNLLGFDSSITHLVVVTLPQLIRKPPRVLNVLKSSDNVSAVCSATGDPPPIVMWSKINGALPAGRSQVLADGTLNMTGLVESDSGQYVCTALVGTFRSQAVLMQLTVKFPKTCKELHDVVRDESSSNKAYDLRLDSGKVPVYCHMTSINGCGSGGWTLVMKTDGSKRTFHYDSALWTNKVVFNIAGGSTGFDRQETKLPTYWQTPFTKVCLGMKVGGETRFISLKKNAGSLYSLIADGQYRTTSLGRDAWKSLISGSSLQHNCNKEGFNAVGARTDLSRARIGITTNNENDCNTNDSRIGFGTGGHPDDSASCGDVSKYGGDNGDKTIKAFGYILVQ